MWEIFEHRSLNKKLKKIPFYILKKYELWKSIVRYNGPEKLKEFSGFCDEALKGKWKFFRSSRLNQQYRVLYQKDDEQKMVFVIDVNSHQY